MKNIVSLRSKLSQARSRGQPWFVLGSLLFQAFATTPKRDHGVIRAEAVGATHISSGVLRRYVVLFERLRNIAAAEGLDSDALMSPVFNAAEVAVRIYERDARKGLASLQDLMVRETTLAELRDQLSEMPAEPGGQTTYRHLDLKSAFVHRALEAARPRLWPTATRLRQRPRSVSFGDRPGLEIVGAGATVLGGIEILLPDHQDIDRYLREVPGLLTLATFYERFYLASPPSLADSYAKRITQEIRTFKASSVGILKIAKNGRIEELIRPAGPPIPNRVEDYPLVIGAAIIQEASEATLASPALGS